MNYLKAEHLKFKRTISNKLLFIAPFLTALFAWIIGGFLWLPVYDLLLVVCVSFSRNDCYPVFTCPSERRTGRKVLFCIICAYQPETV